MRTATATSSMPRHAFTLFILLLSSTTALRLPTPVVTRRTALALPSLALLPSNAHAATEGGVQWDLDLPGSFAIQRRLASIVRIRTETMLSASEESGAQVRLLLVPLGQQVAGSLTGDEQFLLASHFFGGGPDGGDAQAVAKVMADSAARSPSVLGVERVGAARERTDAAGRTYVEFGTEVKRCSEPLDSGECFGEALSRRTLTALTVSPISQFRTNTERARMQELGQTREVNVLWLLTLSAPKASFDGALQKRFDTIAATFVVP